MTKHKKVFNISIENQHIIDEYLTFKTDQKPISRPRNLISPLRALADVLKDKSLKDASKEDLMYFLNPKNKLISIKIRNYTFQQLKLFYRWVDNLDRYTIPERLKWYEPITNKQAQRYADPKRKIKHLITKDDYNRITKLSNDAYGQNKALWETMYLSGARPEEIAKLTYDSIIFEKNGNVSIEIKEGTSKTFPRIIPLSIQPPNLTRWHGNYPFKDESKSSLWISFKTNKPMEINPKDPSDFIRNRLKRIKNLDKKIKQSLTPKSFRKNRASILFSLIKKKDNKYDIGKVAQLMGWSIKTAEERRKEYELTDIDDLKKIVYTNGTMPTDFDAITREKKEIEKKLKDINKLKDYGDDIKSVIKRIDGLEKSIIALSPLINPYYSEDVPHCDGNLYWIYTTTGKMQLIYINKKGFMTEFLKEPITESEYEKNHYDYEGLLAIFLYENKLTKKLVYNDNRESHLEENNIQGQKVNKKIAKEFKEFLHQNKHQQLQNKIHFYV